MVNSFIFVNAMNIMGVATYGYYLGLWHMARGYEIVNQHLKEIFHHLSSFVIYANSSKLTIRICGLFQVDRMQWYSLMCAIMSYAIVLVQFHLYLNRKIY
ncbi:uncharacterized protein Dwil_GK19338 [Drosophila willistoni]|uniref:Gustatory receptor n=1 Tax=Drosophila willistoni TaxID=7260 RepID=A0A0Q9WR30_DROWI|nr:putative gustatory receptor 59b [Drosophila willistoni]KRF97811.1 uncharacterized protein Dwil_GK19338 [Drosophila willistoni]